MTTIHSPGAPVADGVDIDWKIRHLTLLSFTGFATPHTPEAPAVIEARVAQQLEVIAQKRIELAYWESIAAHANTPTNA
jgi:hypothetical protein